MTIELAWFSLTFVIVVVLALLVADAYQDLRIARGDRRLELVAWRDLELLGLLLVVQVVLLAVAIVAMILEPSPLSRLITISMLFASQVLMLVAAIRRWWKRKKGLR